MFPSGQPCPMPTLSVYDTVRPAKVNKNGKEVLSKAQTPMVSAESQTLLFQQLSSVQDNCLVVNF